MPPLPFPASTLVCALVRVFEMRLLARFDWIAVVLAALTRARGVASALLCVCGRVCVRGRVCVCVCSRACVRVGVFVSVIAFFFVTMSPPLVACAACMLPSLSLRPYKAVKYSKCVQK